MFRAAEIARADFSGKLKQGPFESEFDKFVGNIDNYSVGMSDAGRDYVVVFKLKAQSRGIIKGGGAIYRISKKDFVILDFIGQE